MNWDHPPTASAMYRCAALDVLFFSWPLQLSMHVPLPLRTEVDRRTLGRDRVLSFASLYWVANPLETLISLSNKSDDEEPGFLQFIRVVDAPKKEEKTKHFFFSYFANRLMKVVRTIYMSSDTTSFPSRRCCLVLLTASSALLVRVITSSRELEISFVPSKHLLSLPFF